jgi:hypothetical protein
MSLKHIIFFVFMMTLLIGSLAACSSPPYVMNVSEFNRSSVDFGQDQTDISEVTICYRGSSTTPNVVRTIAENECAAFGKSARLINQDYLSCPLATPVAANFVCELPQPNTGSGYYQY